MCAARNNRLTFTQEVPMMYLLTYMQRAGLVSTLLIGGVLGGLMAPLPSDAAPTLTLQVDSGTPVSILGAGGQVCPTGFTSCYVVGGSATGGTPSQTYTVSAAPGLSPRLNLTDIATTDQVKLTGIKIAPVVASFPASETHVLKIVMTNTFSAAPNPAGYYLFAMRTGGYFQAGGTPLDTQYDYVEFKGTGTFCALSTCSPQLINVPLLNVAPSTVNRTPLSLQVGNVATSTSFTLNQVTTYPTFNCKNASDVCAPDITLTYTITLKGSDSLVLSDSNDAIALSCNLIPPGPPLSTPAIPCHTGGKETLSSNIGIIFAGFDVVDTAAAVAVGAVPATPCTVGCPYPTDLGNPMGTITINKQLQCPSGCPQPADFYFDISGAAPLDNKTVQLTIVGGSGILNVPVHSGGPYSVVEQAPPTNWALVTGNPCNGTVPTDGNLSCSFTNQYTPPLGASYFQGNYYLVMPLPDDKHWATARAAAQGLGPGWDLATINSQDEQNFIQTLLPPLNTLSGIWEYWTAGQQPTGSPEPGGNWQWATNNSVFYNNGVTYGYSNWGSADTGPGNEPNDFGGENHVALDNRYKWGWNDNDNNLNLTMGYVAKRSAP